MATILVFCPRNLGITQQSIRHAMRQAGYTSNVDIAVNGADAIKKLSDKLKIVSADTDIHNEVSHDKTYDIDR